MAHETVIGNSQFIYSISIPDSFVLVSTLLNGAQLAELGSHDVLDGYIMSETGGFDISHDPNLVNGAVEPFVANGYAFFPFLNWHRKVYIRSAGGVVTARLKFITGFIRRG